MNYNIGLCVEGPDQSGKSTMCAKLSWMLGLDIHHFSRPEPGADFKTEYTDIVLNGCGHKLIFDRSYMSEMVYGDLFRGGSGVTPEIKEHIETALIENRYALIHLTHAKGVWEDRDEMYTAEDNEKVIKKYYELYPSILLPKIQVNAFDADALNTVLEFIEKQAVNYGS